MPEYEQQPGQELAAAAGRPTPARRAARVCAGILGAVIGATLAGALTVAALFGVFCKTFLGSGGRGLEWPEALGITLLIGAGFALQVVAAVRGWRVAARAFCP
jgi:uncharacterized RDD family membrane protein YckC